MKLTLKRIALKQTYTIGHLYIDGEYFCDTIEDKVRDLKKEPKIKGLTAIPYGIYEVTWSYSPRFKKFTPRLLNVPQFSGVLIHSGNTGAANELEVVNNLTEGGATKALSAEKKSNKIVNKVII